MRLTRWIPIVLTVGLTMMIIGWPLIAAAIEWIAPAAGTKNGGFVTTQPDMIGIILRTALWAAAIAVGSVIVGWFPGRWLGSHSASRASIVLIVACVLPLCLPPYVFFWAWWQACSPGSELFAFLLRHDLVQHARWFTLWLGLVCWAWPLAALFIAGSTANRGCDIEELLAVDHPPLITRMQVLLQMHVRAIILALIVIFLIIFNNTDSFDLAQVRTIGYELRALDSEGATSAMLLQTAWPGIAIAVVLAIVLLFLSRASETTTLYRPARATKIDVILSLLIFMATIALPLAAIITQPNWTAGTTDVIAGYADATANTLFAASFAGIITATLAVAMSVGLGSRLRIIRVVAWLIAAMWIISGTMPAMVNTLAIEAAFNIDATSSWVYRQWPIVVIGYLSRFGFIGVLGAIWIVRLEPAALRDLREVDDIASWRQLWLVHRPRWLAGGVAVFVVVLIVSFGEVIVTSRLRPPGFETIASILLNNMHYQRNEMVVLMSLVLFGFAAIAASIVAIMWRITLHRSEGGL